MKFQLATPDFNYLASRSNGCVNGATVWFDNIARSLRYLGQEAENVSLYSGDYEADYVIIQSEFIDNPKLVKYKLAGGKVICMLSHFDCPHYPTMRRVYELSDYRFTMWSGALMYAVDAHFLPHAYGSLMDDYRVNKIDEIIYAGNTYDLRNEGWFQDINVRRIYGTHPQDLFAFYRGAKLCLNIHGDFQKNIITDIPSAVAKKAGTMINERFWNTLGSGGLLITDYTPQMEEFFDLNDLLVAKTKEEFFSLVEYYKNNREEGIAKLEKARNLVREKHTYNQRVQTMLDICFRS